MLISDETIKYIVGIYAAALFHIIKNLKTIAFWNWKLQANLFRASIKGDVFQGIQPPVLEVRDRFFWVFKCIKCSIHSVYFPQYFTFFDLNTEPFSFLELPIVAL